MNAPVSGWQALAPGTLLASRYRIARPLKVGGMGAVYLAQEYQAAVRTCVVKEMLDPAGSDAEHAERRAWFAREAQMLGSLKHAAIPAIFASFSDSGRYYLAMEYVDGENLQDRLLREGTPGLPEVQVMEWAAQICDLLHYLHSQSPPIVFRDLKPENVMISGGGAIRVVDFGIARVFSPLQQYTMVGTPGYCPPEQYQGREEPLSDLYALAATLHHLLTGRDPRERQPFAFVPIRVLAPAVSEATEQLVKDALRSEIDQRGPPVQVFGQQAWHIANALRQGQKPAPSASRAIFAPGNPLPATHMVVPAQGIWLGDLLRGKQHHADLPIQNDGQSELRVTLYTSAAWLQVPEGQLRVPREGEVRVPLLIDAAHLSTGPQRALIELDGNGGRTVVPIEFQVKHWLLNSMAMLIGTSLGVVVLALVAAYLLAQLL